MKNTIIIIGGLSAGPSAAAKARRENEDAEIILFEKSANISYATCGIPYALSGIISSRDKLLVVEADLLRTRFNIDVRLEEEVIDIDPKKQVITSSKGIYHYDSLVFTTGARAVVPPIKNLSEIDNWSTCRSLKDFDKIMKEGLLESVHKIAILGSGLIGVEVAENIQKLGKEVTLIEGMDQVLSLWQPKFSHFAQREIENNGVTVKKGSFVKEIVFEDKKATQLITVDGDIIDTDFIVISTGIKPNTELLTNKGAKTLKNGALLVNERMETSIPNIYAAGDNASIRNTQTGQHDYLPLGTHSNKGGRTAGANAAGGNEIFKGGYKTAIVQVFDYTLARTGLNAKALEGLGWNYKTNLIIAGATPSYFPGQKDMIIEIYFNPETYDIYGAEIFGEVGVDKRIDVLSTVIYAKLKMTDLPQLDLAYAPPFSPAKDPLIVNGFVTSNRLNNKYHEISIEQFNEKTKVENELQILDVRNLEEVLETGKIDGAIHIDINELRDNLNQLDKNRETIVYCAKGMRGYLALRILANYGFKNVKNLSGGYKMKEMMESRMAFSS